MFLNRLFLACIETTKRRSCQDLVGNGNLRYCRLNKEVILGAYHQYSKTMTDDLFVLTECRIRVD